LALLGVERASPVMEDKSEPVSNHQSSKSKSSLEKSSSLLNILLGTSQKTSIPNQSLNSNNLNNPPKSGPIPSTALKEKKPKKVAKAPGDIQILSRSSVQSKSLLEYAQDFENIEEITPIPPHESIESMNL
jgi:hypothetical protein